MTTQPKSVTRTIVFTPEALPTLAVFSQAVVSSGMVYVSGNIGCDRNFKIVEGGVKAQTRAALENISTILQSAGSDLKYIVKANIYLKDMDRDFMAMNEVYAEFFEKDSLPARTCVGLSTLPMGADVEIECIAELPH